MKRKIQIETDRNRKIRREKKGREILREKKI